VKERLKICYCIISWKIKLFTGGVVVVVVVVVDVVVGFVVVAVEVCVLAVEAAVAEKETTINV
jgi:hypothetical protein